MTTGCISLPPGLTWFDRFWFFAIESDAARGGNIRLWIVCFLTGAFRSD